MKIEAKARLKATEDSLLDVALDLDMPTDDGKAFRELRRNNADAPPMLQQVLNNDGSVDDFNEQALLNDDLAVEAE